MTAKQYLSQLREADMKIDQDIAELSDLQSKVNSIGSFDYSKDRVQTSPDGEAQYTRLLDKIVDMEAEINTEIDNFVDLKKIIIGQIRGISNQTFSKLLFKRYVEYKDLSTIAEEMSYTYPYTRALHTSALQEFATSYTILHLDVV